MDQKNHVRCLLDARARLGECPRWDEKTGVLYWVDIKSCALHRLDPATGTDHLRRFDEEIGCFALDRNGGFVAAMRSGFVRFDHFDAPVHAIADPEADKPNNRFNDGRCDPAGRFIAGTMNETKTAADGTLYGLDWRAGRSAPRITPIIGDALTMNGLAFSPDGARMYYSDTPNHVVYMLDYDVATGVASNRRVFHRFPPGNGRPDGACVDAQGYYWSALYAGGRVVRFSPDGRIVAEVRIPALHCTMIAFGDHDLQTAYVTTARDGMTDSALQEYPQAGGIFAFRVATPGLSEYRFETCD